MKSFKRNIAILLAAVMVLMPTMASFANCASGDHVYEKVSGKDYYQCVNEGCDATVSNADYKVEVTEITTDATEYEKGKPVMVTIKVNTKEQIKVDLEIQKASEGGHRNYKVTCIGGTCQRSVDNLQVGEYTARAIVGESRKNVTFTVKPKMIDPPTADTSIYTYNGEKQTYSPIGFNPTKMVMSNGYHDEAGTYIVTVEPATGYEWANDELNPEFTWAINPAYISGFSWTEPDTKAYDGNPMNIGIICDAIYKGDDCKLGFTIHKDSADGEVVTEAKDPGTYVCVPDNNLSGNDAGNYLVYGSLPENKTYTITPASNPKKSSSSSSAALFTGTWNNAVSNGNWTQDASGVWHYGTTGTFRSTWGYIVNPYAQGGQNSADWFYFDAYGNMLTGWQFIQGKWYYLNPSKDGTLGACQLGGVTPDGWTVDESGAWVESIPKK